MRPKVALLPALLVLAGCGGPLQAIRCSGILATANQTIAACTTLIASGRYRGNDLAVFYYDRALLGYVRKGERRRAIADYSSAIKANPSDAAAYANRGAAYQSRKHDLPLAIADYSAALRISPAYTYAYASRGYAYQRERRFALAIADYNRALRISPDLPFAYMNRGEVYHLEGQDARAVADIDNALRLGSRNAFNASYAYEYRGDAYLGQGESALAIADYDTAMQIRPHAAELYDSRGRAFFAGMRFAAAQKDFATAVVSSPRRAYSALWLYIARMRAGLGGRAEFAIQTAHLNRTKWPAPIIDFYLGKSTIARVLRAARNNDQRCEASFYVAEWQIAKHRARTAPPALRHAAAICPRDYVEYDAARAELQHLAR